MSASASAITAETLKEQGIKSVSIDVAGIMEQKNGKEIMEAIAQKEKITAEELEAVISGGDNMQVNVETFMQVAAQFEGQNITDFANVAGKDAPNMYRMKQVQEALKSIQNFNATKTEETLVAHAQAFYDNYQDVAGKVDGLDSAEVEAIGRKLIGEIARTNLEDFKTGIETVLNGLEADGNERKVLDNMAPALKDLAEDYALTGGLSKEGIAVYRNTLQSLENASPKAKQSTKASGILVARRAEMFAGTMQEMGNQEYTALDYMKRFEVNVNSDVSNFMKHTKIKNLQQKATEQLNEDVKKFGENVDLFLNGKLRGDEIRVMRTPVVMELVGAKVLQINISLKNLKKILQDKHANAIDANILKQIPQALTDPLVIFKSYPNSKTGNERRVVVLDLKAKNGATIVVPFELEVDNKTGGYFINEMLSAYDKTDKYTGEPSNIYFYQEIEKGNLMYINKKRAAAFDNERLETSIPYQTANGSFANIIADENDLRKLKIGNSSLYSEYNFRVRGSTSFMPDGKAIINLFTRATYKTAPADQSTLPHEFGHMFLRDLEELAEMPNAVASGLNLVPTI